MSSKIGCLAMTMTALTNIILGAISVDYILSWFGKDIPLLFDFIIGLIVGEFSVPIAFVGWLLRLFGVF
ncbi:MAG: hypothetical protein ACRC1T_05125 [Clostridium chrysemydis]|uniref:hypothetical protein n=1 Tax=Clostridium chrysemydis TaxID=2665504 RepID=UPI003F32D74B